MNNEEIINTCEYYKICESACGGTLEDTELCSCYQLYKQLKRLEQENAELKEENDRYSLYIKKERDNNYNYRKALEEIKNNCVEMLITIAEEGKPNRSIVDTIWCKNIPCCTLFELIENTQRKINEVLEDE